EENTGKVKYEDTDPEQPKISTTSKLLHPIKDCPMRWNSTYRSWKRLLKLKDAII
ncbi:22106_t:CDS:1, partial [Dentiscutata erythropus]